MTERHKERLKTALVTGGGKRLGAAIVRELAAAGLAVAVHANRSRAPADALVEELRAEGHVAVRVDGDLRDADCPALLFDEAEAALGPIEMLVNNAAIFRFDRLATLTLENLDAHLDVDLVAPLILCRELATRLPPDDGRIHITRSVLMGDGLYGEMRAGPEVEEEE